MINGVGLIIPFQDLKNYDYKKIEKILKEQIINEVETALEQQPLNMTLELEERFGQPVVRIVTKVIIDFDIEES